jgi:hypothetical protein
MKNSLGIGIFTALMAFFVLPILNVSAAPKIPCEGSVDCPNGFYCSVKTGLCVSAPKRRVQARVLTCESHLDCPLTARCCFTPHRETGVCTPTSKACK